MVLGKEDSPVMLTKMKCILLSIVIFCALSPATSLAQSKASPSDKFRQLEEILPTPNEQRAASGAPGHSYWQQRADYTINVELDDANQRITGSETVTYYNNSPDALDYLWLQLDQNIFNKASEANSTRAAPTFTVPTPEPSATPGDPQISFSTIDRIIAGSIFEGGQHITSVRDAKGNPLRFTVVGTMMRVDLPAPLAPGQNTAFSVDWNYQINDAKRLDG